jgi:hypothetical protein
MLDTKREACICIAGQPAGNPRRRRRVAMPAAKHAPVSSPRSAVQLARGHTPTMTVFLESHPRVIL